MTETEIKKIIRQYNIRTLDLVHLVTAQANPIDEVVAFAGEAAAGGIYFQTPKHVSEQHILCENIIGFWPAVVRTK